MELDVDLCWRAVTSRDRRFEGRFVLAVTTTGIYCRPGCPARLPRRRNTRFFACPAAAEEAGFRPCRRCRPDSSPGSPAWAGSSATVSRGVRAILEGGLDERPVDDLAARLGVGARHLRRLFADHLGASPRSLAKTRRVHFARRLIEQTRLPMAEVATRAGFASIRRFNEAMRETFGASPRALRAGVRAAPATPGLALRLPWREPMAWRELLAYLAARATPGVESVTGGVYRRSIALDGTRGVLEARPDAEGRGLEIVLPPLAGRLLEATRRVARIFDLDADTLSIAGVLGADRHLRPLVRRRPGLRVPGAWDPFELAVRAILGQQISVRAATTFAGRLATTFGEPLPEPLEDVTHVFPTPAALANARLERIGLPAARAATVRAFAHAVDTGTLALHADRGLEDAIERLVRVPGIGPWTAHYVAMWALREPDAFPASDLGLRQALARDGALPSAADVAKRAEAWRPWRAYAAVHLWTSLAAPSRRRTT